MRRFAIYVLTALVVVTVAPVTHATQVIYKSPQQLGEESALVVQGRVASVRSFWNPQRTKIYTETIVAVDDTFKGRSASTVSLLQLGGEVDGVRVSVHGALNWRLGEEVLLFLEPYTGGSFHVSGFSQGKYEIERDPRTGEPFVRQAAAPGVQLVGGSGTDANTIKGTADKMKVSDFVDYAVGGAKGGQR